MKNKIIIIIAIGLLLVSINASAHEFKRDGRVGALLHTEPGDDPVAGDPSFMLFSFDDTEGKFNLLDCECEVTVFENSIVLLNRKINAQDEAKDWGINVARVDFVFPYKAVYQVNIKGTSKSNSFPPFNITYDRRVDKGLIRPPAASANNNYYWAGAGLILFAIILSSAIIIRKRKWKKQK